MSLTVGISYNDPRGMAQQGRLQLSGCLLQLLINE